MYRKRDLMSKVWIKYINDFLRKKDDVRMRKYEKDMSIANFSFI